MARQLPSQPHTPISVGGGGGGGDEFGATFPSWGPVGAGRHSGVASASESEDEGRSAASISTSSRGASSSRVPRSAPRSSDVSRKTRASSAQLRRRVAAADSWCGWHGSEYLSPSGTLLSRSDSAPSQAEGQDAAVVAAERVARYAASAAAAAAAAASGSSGATATPAVPHYHHRILAPRDRDHRRGQDDPSGGGGGGDSPRLEHIPTHIVAPVFPFMGQDHVHAHAAAAAGGFGGDAAAGEEGEDEGGGEGTDRMSSPMAPPFALMAGVTAAALPSPSPTAHASSSSSAASASAGTAAGSSSFGGWVCHPQHALQHDRPLLRFLPGDALANQYAHETVPSSSDITAAVARGHSVPPGQILHPPQAAQMSKAARRRAADAAADAASAATELESSPRTSPPAPPLPLPPPLPSPPPRGSPRSSPQGSPQLRSMPPPTVPPLLPAAGASRTDPLYSPELLAVTNQWWQTCARSDYLLAGCSSAPATAFAPGAAAAVAATPSSNSSPAPPALPSPPPPHPPLLPQLSYCSLRLLVLLALLPAEEVAGAKKVQQLVREAVEDFAEEVGAEGGGGAEGGEGQGGERCEVEASSSPCPAADGDAIVAPSHHSPTVPPGLTLPMFHLSLCSLAAEWTQIGQVDEEQQEEGVLDAAEGADAEEVGAYVAFLSKLHEDVTEEVVEAEPAIETEGEEPEAKQQQQEGTGRREEQKDLSTRTDVQSEGAPQGPSDRAVGADDASGSRPSSPAPDPLSPADTATAPAAPRHSSPPPPPRRFKPLPPALLAALCCASEARSASSSAVTRASTTAGGRDVHSSSGREQRHEGPRQPLLPMQNESNTRPAERHASERKEKEESDRARRAQRLLEKKERAERLVRLHEQNQPAVVEAESTVLRQMHRGDRAATGDAASLRAGGAQFSPRDANGSSSEVDSARRAPPPRLGLGATATPLSSPSPLPSTPMHALSPAPASTPLLVPVPVPYSPGPREQRMKYVTGADIRRSARDGLGQGAGGETAGDGTGGVGSNSTPRAATTTPSRRMEGMGWEESAAAGGHALAKRFGATEGTQQQPSQPNPASSPSSSAVLRHSRSGSLGALDPSRVAALSAAAHCNGLHASNGPRATGGAAPRAGSAGRAQFAPAGAAVATTSGGGGGGGGGLPEFSQSAASLSPSLSLTATATPTVAAFPAGVTTAALPHSKHSRVQHASSSKMMSLQESRHHHRDRSNAGRTNDAVVGEEEEGAMGRGDAASQYQQVSHPAPSPKASTRAPHAVAHTFAPVSTPHAHATVVLAASPKHAYASSNSSSRTSGRAGGNPHAGTGGGGTAGAASSSSHAQARRLRDLFDQAASSSRGAGVGVGAAAGVHALNPLSARSRVHEASLPPSMQSRHYDPSLHSALHSPAIFASMGASSSSPSPFPVSPAALAFAPHAYSGVSGTGGGGGGVQLGLSGPAPFVNGAPAPIRGMGVGVGIGGVAATAVVGAGIGTGASNWKPRGARGSLRREQPRAGSLWGDT